MATLQNFQLKKLSTSTERIWTAICYGNGMFVAISANTNPLYNGLATSIDGINWTFYNCPISGSWSSIAYGDGKFVVVNSQDTSTMVSTDGINWTVNNGLVKCISVCYGLGAFYAVGIGGASASERYIIKSIDGITWNYTSQILASYQYSKIIFNGTKISAFTADTGSIYYSSDGSTWILTGSIVDKFSDVGYGNGLWVAVSPYTTNKLWTSTNGIDWTLRTVPSKYWANVIYGNGKWIVTSNGDLTNSSMYSINGTTWTLGDLNGFSNKICYGNNVFVSLSSYGYNRRSYSLNGTSWTTLQDSKLISIRSIVYANNKYIASINNGENGESFVIGTSINLIDWQYYVIPLAISNVNYITFGNNMFIGVSNSGHIVKSTNGENWNIVYTHTNPFISLTFGNGIFIATDDTGTNNLFRSTDGSNWVRSTAPVNSTIYKIIYGNNLWIGGTSTNTGKLMSSIDGINWTVRDGMGNGQISTMAYGNGVYLIGCSNGTNRLIRSTNGTNWSIVNMTIFDSLYKVNVIYTNNIFILCGWDNVNLTSRCWTSVDGNTWIERQFVGPFYLSSMTLYSYDTVVICSFRSNYDDNVMSIASFLTIINKYFLKNTLTGEYLVPTGVSAWSIQGTTLPTEALFLSHGIDNLDVFNGTVYDGINAGILSDNPVVLNYTNDPIVTSKNLTINHIPDPELMLPTGDINIESILDIDSVTLVGNESGTGVIRVIASIDSGVTWYSYKGGSWVSVDISNIQNVRNNGMTISELNALTNQQIMAFIGIPNKLRFGYYLEVSQLTDVANTDSITMIIDMPGTWDKAQHGVDFDYNYPSSTTLTVELLANGDYKINY